MKVQNRSRRKASGARYHKLYRKKRLSESGREAYLTKVSEDTKIKPIKVRSAAIKRTIISTNIANLSDPETKTFKKVKIQSVSGNAANRHYVRRNIITKGAIIDTEAGKAKVTSRPGQDGVINAVLIKE